LLAAAFFIYNAFAITLAERAREIGQLRALGMTRGQVLRLTLTEALVIALLGSALGLLLGAVLAQLMTTESGVATSNVPLDGILLSVGVGVVITLGTVFNLARRAGRVSPLTALNVSARNNEEGHTSRWPRWLAVVGFILFGLIQWATLTYLKDPPTVTTSFLLSLLPPFLLGLAILGLIPLLVSAALKVGARLSLAWPIPARLALYTLARQPGRATLTTLTLTIGLMLVVSLAGTMQGLLTSTIENFIPVFANYDFALGRATDSYEVGPPIPPALQADLDSLAVDTQLLRYGSIPTPNPEDGLFGISSPIPVYVGDLEFFTHTAMFRPVEGSWDEAARYFAAGPALAIPEIASHRLNLHPGDTISLDTYEGQVAFTVAVVSQAFIIPVETSVRYFHAYPTLWFFRARPGTDLVALRAHAGAIANAHQLLFVEDPHAFFSDFITTFFRGLLALFGSLTSISGIVAGLGIANTLSASVLERQRELGTLRAIGFTRGQVRGMVVIEAGMLGLMGATIGVLGGLAMSLASFQLTNASFATSGFAPLQSLPLPWTTALFALVAGPLIAMLAALWPANRAAQMSPVEAMRTEGEPSMRLQKRRRTR